MTDQELRSLFAYAVMATSREWNGDTWTEDQAATDRRLDSMVEQYREQS